MTADGWHIGKWDAHYLTRNGICIAVVFWRVGGWCWWDFATGESQSFLTCEAAKKAADEWVKR